MSTQIDAMLQAAKAVRGNAYSPYSNFSVGCAIRTSDNYLFCGCNIENASYGLTLCAENVAVGAMVSAGYTEIAEVLIYAEGSSACWPCGRCRQMLREFSNSGVIVHAYDVNGVVAEKTIDELLPCSFSRLTMGK